MPDDAQNDVLENGILLTIPLDELQTYHANPRIGNVGAIKDSLRTNGQFRPILVNRGTLTGRENEILAGNHTFLAARELHRDYPRDPEWENLECYVVDVDTDQATRIVLADNRTAELGTFDDLALLEELGKLDSISGTGYDPADLMALEDILKGAPSLDELEREAGGEPKEEDSLVIVKLSLSKETNDKFWDLFSGFETHEEMMTFLFEEAYQGGSDRLPDRFFASMEDSSENSE